MISTWSGVNSRRPDVYKRQLQLLVLLVHLLLLSLYSLALHLLIGRILADEGKAAIHLCQILGTED